MSYSLTAHCPIGLGEIEVEIYFSYTPGLREQGPSYASGGEPAEEPEVEYEECDFPGAKTCPSELDGLIRTWAEEWFNSNPNAYSAAVEAARDQGAPHYR